MELYLEETRTLLWMGSILYGLAFIFALASLILERHYSRIVFYTLLAGGFFFQGIGLYLRGLAFFALPLTNPMEIVQVISWCSMLLILMVQMSFRLILLGFFGTAMATLLGLTSLSITSWDYENVTSALQNPWIEFHAALAIFAYGAFGILAVTALMYLLQHYGLTRKRFGGFFTLLPSLQQLDNIMTRLLLMGVTVFTVALFLGIVTWFSDFQSVNLYTLLYTAVLWVCYFSLLILKEKKRWIGKHIGWSCLILFVFALLSLWPIHTS